MPARAPQMSPFPPSALAMLVAAGLALAPGAPAWGDIDGSGAAAQEPRDAAADANPDGPTTAARSRRIVRVFDFDEPANPDEVPAGWVRAQSPPQGVDRDKAPARPGFPDFNRAGFDFDTRRSGTASVRLPTQGGSTSLRLRPGEMPIFPDADYLVTAAVQTDALRSARAFLVARLLDQRLVPIPGAESRSGPVLSPGVWTNVSVTLPGRFPQAAWLQIDLELLQPAQFQPQPQGPLAQHTIVREDVRGAAWFDDVAIMQIPRARLWSSDPDNIIRARSTEAAGAAVGPTLFFSARDLAAEPLTADLVVFDVQGRPVDRLRSPITPDGRPLSWTPRLPLFGWYTARLTVRAGEEAVSSDAIDFAFLAPPPAASATAAALADRARLGIIAEDLPEPLLARMPALTDQIGTGFLVLPLFDPALPAADQPAAALRRAPLYTALMERSQVITLSLPRVPDALARTLALDPSDAVGMAARSQSAWAPYLQPTIDTFGQRLTRYQLGGVGDPHVLRRDPAPPLAALESVLERLVPDPHLSLTWWADHDPPTIARPAGPTASGSTPPRPLIDGVTLLLPASFPDSALPEIIDRWTRTAMEPGLPPPQLTLVPELLDPDRFGAFARLSEMARRTISFWAAAGALGDDPASPIPPPRLALKSPWRLVVDPDSPTPETAQRIDPGPALAAMHTLVDRLAGRRVVGTLAAPDGVRALILAARPAGASGTAAALERGAIVAWNVSAPEDRARVEFAPAGSSATLVDIFGNTRPILPAPPAGGSPADRAALVPILSAPVSATPTFIEDVDPYLALFVSGFRIEPAFLRAVASEHEQRLILTNPWPVRLAGKLQIRGDASSASGASGGAPSPDDWNVSPQGVIDFSIPPGQTIEIPITVTLSARQLAGRRDIAVIARVQADRAYPPIRLTAPVEIGLPELDLTPELILSPGPEGPDAIVSATITNRDTRARSLILEAAARGQATQQIQISDLAPGASTQRRFVFRAAAADLAGRRILVSLADPESAARLNKAVQVP